jgi:GntP family gluconate:H+ symporter
MLIINGFVGLVAMAGGILWVTRFCKNSWIEYDKKLENTLEPQEVKQTENHKTQSVLLDLLPIIVPIVLMGIGAFYNPKDQGVLSQWITLVSTPMIAVLVGAGIAMLQFKRHKSKTGINQLVEQAIVKSALVIMITGAGGAFGYVIRESGIQDSLAMFFVELPFLGFLLPFLVAAVLTTATGSITVSLIGTASIVGPLASTMPYSPEMMAALIGSGSFIVFHANSSFFWLLNRLHEVPVNVLYRTYTTQSLVMGITGLLAAFLLFLGGVH